MFVEGKSGGSTGVVGGWLDGFLRHHPGLFAGALFVLAAIVTLGLLLKPTYTVVLYQGF